MSDKMKNLEKKGYKIFYSTVAQILKTENLCHNCFLPCSICENECQKILNSREFWKFRSDLFQRKLSRCCFRKRKIIGELCLNYVNYTGNDFYYNEFLIFISKQGKNVQCPRTEKSENLDKEQKNILPRKQRNIRKRRSVLEVFSSEYNL